MGECQMELGRLGRQLEDVRVISWHPAVYRERRQVVDHVCDEEG